MGTIFHSSENNVQLFKYQNILRLEWSLSFDLYSLYEFIRVLKTHCFLRICGRSFTVSSYSKCTWYLYLSQKSKCPFWCTQRTLRGLKFILSLHLHPYFVYARSDCCDENVHYAKARLILRCSPMQNLLKPHVLVLICLWINIPTLNFMKIPLPRFVSSLFSSNLPFTLHRPAGPCVTYICPYSTVIYVTTVLPAKSHSDIMFYL